MGFLVIPTLSKTLDLKAVRVIAEDHVHLIMHRDGSAELLLRDGARVSIHAEAITHHADLAEAVHVAHELAGSEVIDAGAPV